MPGWLRAKIQASEADELYVECVRKVTREQVASGLYEHLDISFRDNQMSYADSVLPAALVGRSSNRNRNGREIIRRDLPKVRKIFGPWTVPVFGDRSKGYCSVSPSRMVYARQIFPAQELTLSVSLLEQEARSGEYALRFRVNRQLNRTDSDFQEELLFCVNLLQENTGAADVYPVGTTSLEYLKVVDWEILPPGEDTRERMLTSLASSTAEVRATFNDRFNFLTSLSPVQFINGTNGFGGYFGARFSNELIAFENTRYGCAIYVMRDHWQELSQWSRLDLVRQRPEGFVRIPHTDGWQERLRNIINRG